MFHLAELAAIWVFAERALALILLDSASSDFGACARLGLGFGFAYVARLDRGPDLGSGAHLGFGGARWPLVGRRWPRDARSGSCPRGSRRPWRSRNTRPRPLVGRRWRCWRRPAGGAELRSTAYQLFLSAQQRRWRGRVSFVRSTRRIVYALAIFIRQCHTTIVP